MITHIFAGAYPEYWNGALRWCHQCQVWVEPDRIFDPCPGPVVESCPCCLPSYYEGD